jgi:hypothetical protein
MTHGRKLLKHVAAHAVVQTELEGFYMDNTNALLAIAVTASFGAAYLIGVMLADAKAQMKKLREDEDGSVWIRGERYIPEDKADGQR